MGERRVSRSLGLRSLGVIGCLGSLLSACSAESLSPRNDDEGESEAVHVLPIQGARAAADVGSRSQALGTAGIDGLNGISYRGGSILDNINLYVVFYGAFTPSEISLVEEFLFRLPGSPYFHINTTYYNPKNHARVANGYTMQRPVAVTDYPVGTDLDSVKPILTDQLDKGKIPTDPTGVYLVLTGKDVKVKKFDTSACGWHSTITYQNVKYPYAFAGYSKSALCGVTSVSPNGLPAIDAMVSAIAHELEETATDPKLNAWGAGVDDGENADLCAWTYGPLYLTSNDAIANVKLGTRDYKIQRNWVNRDGGYCSMFLRAHGDVNGDGHADLAAIGPSGDGSIPFGIADSAGSFSLKGEASSSPFQRWASEAGVRRLPGDFDGDGLADFALLGGKNWKDVVIAYSRGDGTFRMTDVNVLPFATWAQDPTVRAVPGDFDSDGKADIALLGGANWNDVVIAFSNGDGTFRVTDEVQEPFGVWAADPQVKAIPGDFDGDGRADIALVGASWPDVAIGFSNGDGTFTVTDLDAPPNFGKWAGDPAVKVLPGDFDRDGASDLALLGGPGWKDIVVGFSNGDGTFRMTDIDNPYFAKTVLRKGAQVAAGDFNGDGATDLVATGFSDTTEVITALSKFNGTFANNAVFEPAGVALAARNGATILSGF